LQKELDYLSVHDFVLSLIVQNLNLSLTLIESKKCLALCRKRSQSVKIFELEIIHFFSKILQT